MISFFPEPYPDELCYSLFARYRRIARHGVIAEHAEPTEARAEQANGVPVAPER